LNELVGGVCRRNSSSRKAVAMSRSRPNRTDQDRGIQSAARGVALGETFHKKNIPWVLWTVTRINANIKPAHVELTKRKDSKTRITVSVDTLTNHRYFSPCGDEGPIFPPMRHAGAAVRNGRMRPGATRR
jgi:hypothetical protein